MAVNPGIWNQNPFSQTPSSAPQSPFAASPGPAKVAPAQNPAQTQQPTQTPFDQLTPDQLALQLGSPGYTPGYDSNQKGSFENNYNQALNRLTPAQLIQRYSKVNPNQLNTALDQSGYQAYQSFKSLFGRDPSTNEFSQILPAFQGPNGQMNGNAALANMQNQYKSNPAIDPTSTQNTQTPTDIQGQVTQQFQSILGRAPTSDELSHFTQAIQTNQTDAYGLGSFLKQQPEYTNAQDATFRNSLNTELQGYDTTEFDKEKSGVMADYMSRGMAPGTSPSLDYALTSLMGNIAQNRSSYLANLSASQYGGDKQLAEGNYQNTLDQMYSTNQSNLSNQRAYGQQLLNQGFQGADYQTQQNNLMNYMGSQPQQRSPNAFDYLNAGANVAKGVGSLVGAFNG